MCFNTPNFFDERDPLTADTFSDTGADVDEEDDDDADTDADADAMTAFAARDACIPLSGEYQSYLRARSDCRLRRPLRSR